jgi:hypothetical protein
MSNKNTKVCHKEVRFRTFSLYSQTCIKRSPVGQIKGDLIRVTSYKRFYSCEIFYERKRKGDLLIQVTA